MGYLNVEYISKCLTATGYYFNSDNNFTVPFAPHKEDNTIVLFSKKRGKTKESSSALAISREIKIFDSETNITTNYPSIRKAASAIKVDVKSLNRHCLLIGNLVLNPLYKNRYLIDEVASKPRKSHTLSKNLAGFEFDLKDLEKDKVYFFEQDKKTLSYVFNNCWEAARGLTPKRCIHLSDEELKRSKNLQHIRRVINKGVLTKTEKGNFYVFQNSGYSSSLDLVVFGTNLCSTVGVKQLSILERNMVKLPNFQLSVMIGLLLSDASFSITER